MVFKIGDRVIVKALYESGSGNPRHPCKGVILPPHECKMTLRETKYYIRFVTFNYGTKHGEYYTNTGVFNSKDIELDKEYYREESLRDILDNEQ